VACGSLIGTRILKHPHHIPIAMLRRLKQRGYAMVVLGVHVGLGVEQYPHHIGVPTLRRQIQRSERGLFVLHAAFWMWRGRRLWQNRRAVNVVA
jgi:hypothetical protein